MLANGKQCIIFPLRAKLNLMFAQQRPKVYGGRRVVLLPVLPWTDGDRPPNLAYGKVRGSPILNMNCWIGFGLCALDALSIKLQAQYQTVLRPNFGARSSPDVVHSLRPWPKQVWTIQGVTRDSTGAVLPSCNVDLYSSADPEGLQGDGVVSDANGNYKFYVNDGTRTYFVWAYKTGAPDVTGVTANTLVGT